MNDDHVISSIPPAINNQGMVAYPASMQGVKLVKYRTGESTVVSNLLTPSSVLLNDRPQVAWPGAMFSGLFYLASPPFIVEVISTLLLGY